jgi:DNA-binding transcriptional LysR family regulator
VVTLDQARALDALERHGTFVRAAAALRRGHTSVLYLIRTLEDTLGFAVLDRSGYRTKLTPAGTRILEHCRALLSAEAGLDAAIGELRAGWEPSLTVIFDGIVPIEPLLVAVGELARERVPTRIDVRAEFLAGVEDTFVQTKADLMIGVLPARASGLVAIDLPVIKSSLVAHASHPLVAGTSSRAGAKSTRAGGKSSLADLRQHVLLTVRGSDPRLELPTSSLDRGSTIHLNDFAAKRAAILAGIGYGWLPDAMIETELARGRVKRVRWNGASTHRFHPRLYHRGHRGPAARRLIAALAPPA